MSPTDSDDDDRPLSNAELDRNWAAAQRERGRIMRRLIELLRPLMKTDPLFPAICDHFCFDCEESGLLDLCVEFARLRHEALRHRHGPDHRETRSAHEHLLDCKELLKQQKAERRR